MTRGRAALAAALGLALAGAVLGREEHPHFFWQAVPSYGAIFGFGGTWLLVWLAKDVVAPLARCHDDDEGAGT